MLNPILAFSATRRMRSFRTVLILIAYMAVLLVIALAFLNPFMQNSLSMENLMNGMKCYLFLLVAQLGLLILIAPATANIIGKIAGGIADDLLTAVVMAAAERTPTSPLSSTSWGAPSGPRPPTGPRPPPGTWS